MLYPVTHQDFTDILVLKYLYQSSKCQIDHILLHLMQSFFGAGVVSIGQQILKRLKLIAASICICMHSISA